MSDQVEEFDLLGDAEPARRRRGLGLGSILILIALLVFAVFVGLALMRQKQGPSQQGPAPEFSVTTFDGQKFSLADLRGKVVVVNFWASWCVPCQEESPTLESLWRKYQDRDVVFLGVAYADTDSDSRAFLQKYGITYANAPDLGTQISYDYHISGVPETFVIDQTGQIAQYYYAQITTDQLSADLDRLLEAA